MPLQHEQPQIAQTQQFPESPIFDGMVAARQHELANGYQLMPDGAIETRAATLATVSDIARRPYKMPLGATIGEINAAPTTLAIEAAGTVPDGAEPVDIPAGTGRRRRIEAVADSTPAQEKPTETTTALRAVRIPGTVLGASAPVSAPTPAPGRYRVVFGKPTDKN